MACSRKLPTRRARSDTRCLIVGLDISKNKPGIAVLRNGDLVAWNVVRRKTEDDGFIVASESADFVSQYTMPHFEENGGPIVLAMEVQMGPIPVFKRRGIEECIEMRGRILQELYQFTPEGTVLLRVPASREKKPKRRARIEKMYRLEAGKLPEDAIDALSVADFAWRIQIKKS